MDVTRRDFLRIALQAAGTLAVASCTKSSPDSSPIPTLPGRVGSTVRLRSAAELAPSARPTLRLPGQDFGFPSPFSYLPPNYERVNLIYDTLLMLDPTGAVLPWLAATHQASADGITHTFELRENVRWHDGQPLTPADVVFSFEYFASQKAKGNLPPFLVGGPGDDVVKVRTVGARGVEIRLDEPKVTFVPTVAARFPIVPRHIWEPIDKAGEMNDRAKLVGTGPYRLDSYGGSAGGYLYSANDEFFLGRPFVKRIEMVPVENELAALRTGDIDAGGFQVEATSARALAPFLSDPSYGVVEDDLDFVVALNWNIGKGGPLSDVRFRRACAHAINRVDGVRRLLGGNGATGNPGFLPPGHPFHAEVEQYPFDLALAGRLLDELGYRRAGGSTGTRRGPDGKPLRLKLTTPVRLAPSAQLVVRALDEVGIGVEIDPIDQVFFLGNDYDMALVFYGGIGGDPDYLGAIYSSRRRRDFRSPIGYTNPELDDLVDRQAVTLQEDQRRPLVARIQQIAAEDLPLLHLYYPKPFLIFKKAKFDQWPPGRNGGNNFKHPLTTGVGTGGLEIRPTIG